MNRQRRQSGSHDGDITVRALHSDLELTRAELGETLAALASKVDLKARAQEYAHDSADRLAEAADTVRRRAGQRTARLAEHRGAIALASAALSAFAVGVLVRRRFGQKRPLDARARQLVSMVRLRTPVRFGLGMNTGGCSGSVRRAGNRSSRMFMATLPSSRASGAPRQKWMPRPKPS